MIKGARKISIPLNVKVSAPDDLNLMTPYVLLEQGDWFEQEIHFVRRLLTPGNAVIDIGANYGVYALTSAALVGSSGHVWAFEPASTTADYLQDSVRTNQFDNVTVIRAALSNEPGEAHLSTHDNAELNTLNGEQGDKGETVALTTLDLCLDRFAGRDIAFLKLDAEGEEANVIRGGAHFFASQSPLVMFEIKHKAAVNINLVDIFEELGYESYRLIPGLGILVPFKQTDALDAAQLNLFACKRDRAEQLAERNLLVLEESNALPPEKNSNKWLNGLSQSPWNRDYRQNWQAYLSDNGTLGWLAHKAALNDYVTSQTPTQSPAVRLAALRRAYAGLRELTKSEPNTSRLSSLVRISTEIGERQSALMALQQLQQALRQSGVVDLTEPTLAITPRFDDIVPGAHLSDWLIGSLMETLEKLSSFSSYFTPQTSLTQLKAAAALHFASPDLQHRIALVEKRLATLAGYTETEVPAVNSLADILPRPTNPIGVVDIGALMLNEDSAPYDKLLKTGLATVVGFEPNEPECERLRQHYGSAHRFYPHFIGDGKPGTYYETNMVMTGSLYKPDKKVMDKFMNLYELCTPVAEHPVLTHSLDDLEDLGLVDYIKIDVQGAELSVFKGASKALSTALFVHTEVEFAALYENQPLFAEVDQHLRAAGFQFHTFDSIGQRSFKPIVVDQNINRGLRQILWADAIYVRDFTRFEKLTSEQLIKIALIAHEVYRSYDLAHHAIANLDLKEGTDFATQYLRLLQTIQHIRPEVAGH